ncbi:hypothetical protein V5O48_009601 [Marasmius crinis-equi]|uniref:Uncharacterized protein n=1 Tax=Marasmius crinis-equi TaxID=585013 RepID=A0ABR3FBE1_9AGAR
MVQLNHPAPPPPQPTSTPSHVDSDEEFGSSDFYRSPAVQQLADKVEAREAGLTAHSSPAGLPAVSNANTAPTVFNTNMPANTPAMSSASNHNASSAFNVSNTFTRNEPAVSNGLANASGASHAFSTTYPPPTSVHLALVHLPAPQYLAAQQRQYSGTPSPSSLLGQYLGTTSSQSPIHGMTFGGLSEPHPYHAAASPVLGPSQLGTSSHSQPSITVPQMTPHATVFGQMPLQPSFFASAPISSTIPSNPQTNVHPDVQSNVQPAPGSRFDSLSNFLLNPTNITATQASSAPGTGSIQPTLPAPAPTKLPPAPTSLLPRPGPEVPAINDQPSTPPMPPPSQIGSESPLRFTNPGSSKPPSAQLDSHSPSLENPSSGAEVEDSSDPTVGRHKALVDGTFEEIDDIFLNDIPDDLSANANEASAQAHGGRPTAEQLLRIDQGLKKVDQAFRDLSKVTGIEVPSLLDRYFSKVKGTKRKTGRHLWNDYERYIKVPEHMVEEMARLNDIKDLRWDGKSHPTSDQTRKAYQFFLSAHGDDKARHIITLWAFSEDITPTQQRARRRRIWEAAVHEVDSLGDRLRDLYQIHLFALLVGGQVQSDQSFHHVYEKHESAGFSEKGWVLDAEELIAAEGTLREFTNQQLADMCETRGLTVSGLGVDNTSKAGKPRESKSAVGNKAPRVRDVILNVAKENGISLSTDGTLPWKNLPKVCIDRGIQMYNYPLGVREPWKTPSSRRHQGAAELNETEQKAFIAQCEQDHEYRFEFRQVDPLSLRNNDIPILVSAPKPDGKRCESFAREVPDLKVKGKKAVVKSEKDSDSSSSQAPAGSEALPPSTRTTRSSCKAVPETSRVEEELTSDIEDGSSAPNDDQSYVDEDEMYEDDNVETPKATKRKTAGQRPDVSKRQKIEVADKETTPVKQLPKRKSGSSSDDNDMGDKQTLEPSPCHKRPRKAHSGDTFTPSVGASASGSVPSPLLSAAKGKQKENLAGSVFSQVGFTDFSKLPKRPATGLPPPIIKSQRETGHQPDDAAVTGLPHPYFIQRATSPPPQNAPRPATDLPLSVQKVQSPPGDESP